MDKINQNRHGAGERGEELFPRFTKVRFFIYLFILFIFLILPSVGIMVIYTKQDGNKFIILE